jgi:Zn-dependent peptidase ImmA (M78 family)
VHCLTLNAYLHLDDAEYVVWHELTHALQAEKIGGSTVFDRAWIGQLHEVGLTVRGITAGMSPQDCTKYDAMPYEKQANKVASARPRRIQVTVPR